MLADESGRTVLCDYGAAFFYDLDQQPIWEPMEVRSLDSQSTSRLSTPSAAACYRPAPSALRHPARRRSSRGGASSAMSSRACTRCGPSRQRWWSRSVSCATCACRSRPPCGRCLATSPACWRATCRPRSARAAHRQTQSRRRCVWTAAIGAATAQTAPTSACLALSEPALRITITLVTRAPHTSTSNELLLSTLKQQTSCGGGRSRTVASSVPGERNAGSLLNSTLRARCT